VPRAGKLLVAVSAGLPPAAAAAWRDAFVRHPVAAAGLMLAYYVVLGIGVLIAKAVSGPTDRRLKQLGDAADRAFGRRMSHYGRLYRDHVLTSLRLVDTKGLATGGPYTPELDEVFVDLGLTSRPPHQISGAVLPGFSMDTTERRSIHEFLDHEESVVLAVIGAPGSGKTTLLRHIARQAIRTGRRRRRTVPILLVLRDYSEKIAAAPNMTLPQLVRADLSGLPFSEPEGWWEHQLFHGNCLVLMDGLDEVAAVKDRRAMADWIERQIGLYGENDYVITSRPHGYLTAAVSPASVLQVRPFTDDRVTRFLRAWYLATERHASDGQSGEVEIRAQSAATDLLGRLATAPALYDLTVNPLLLTMIANVHRYRGALPGSRADLYGEVCEVMLWRRQEAKRLAIDLPGARKVRLLAHLAFMMMQDRVRDLSRQQILEVLKPGLRRMSTIVTPEDFLADVESSGLLIEREKGLYAFAHHTFGEYLAAQHIRENGLNQVLLGAVDDAWWRESTLLYASDADADTIVEACLGVGTITALALAFDCAGAGELDPSLRERLDQILAAAFYENADLEHRRLVAGVLATRHLSGLVPTSVGTRVCPRPITKDLYWLFIKETEALPPYGPQPFRPDATQPVTGIWAQDALACAAWINDTIAISGWDPVYRLPTQFELQELANRAGLLSQFLAGRGGGVWTQPESDRSAGVWTLAEAPDPRLVTGADLVAVTAVDITDSPVLLQLALVSTLALVPLRVLARVLVLELDFARGLDHNHPRLSEILAAGLQNDIDLGRALGRVLEHEYVFDDNIDHHLASVLVRALGLDFSIDDGAQFERHLFEPDLPAVEFDLHTRAVRATADAHGIDGALAHACGLALEIEHHHGGSLRWDRDLARDLDRELGRILHGMQDLVVDLDYRRDPQALRDLLGDIDFVSSFQIFSRLDGSESEYFNLGRAVHVTQPSRFIATLVDGLDDVRDIYRQLTLDGDLYNEILPGRGLAHAFSAVLALTGDRRRRNKLQPWDETLAEGWDKTFARSLIHDMGISDSYGFTVGLEEVTGLVREACAAMGGGGQATSWAATVAGHLAETAEPVFGRHRPLVPTDPIAIRLPALVLAAEADDHKMKSVGDAFRTIAAAITLLQRRDNNQAACETLVLASA
jgi:hypothetical protein